MWQVCTFIIETTSFMSSPFLPASIQSQCNNVCLRTFYCALQNLVWINLSCLQHRIWKKNTENKKHFVFRFSCKVFCAFLSQQFLCSSEWRLRVIKQIFSDTTHSECGVQHLAATFAIKIFDREINFLTWICKRISPDFMQGANCIFLISESTDLMCLLFAYDVLDGRQTRTNKRTSRKPLNFMTFYRTATSQGVSEKGIGKSEWKESWTGVESELMLIGITQ